MGVGQHLQDIVSESRKQGQEKVERQASRGGDGSGSHITSKDNREAAERSATVGGVGSSGSDASVTKGKSTGCGDHYCQESEESEDLHCCVRERRRRMIKKQRGVV